MTEPEALAIIEKMTTQEFNHFLIGLPARVGMLVRSGMVDWKAVLPAWYIRVATMGGNEPLDLADIPY